MAFRRQHFGDGEGGELGRRIVDAIDFKAQRGQGDRNRLDPGVGVEMRLEPGQGELHALTPPERVGTSKAEKP